MFGSLGVPELVMIAAVSAAALGLVAYPAGRICARAGFSPWLGLLAPLPLLNVGLLFFVAFADWPRIDSARPSRSDTA